MAETIIKINLNESPYTNDKVSQPLASRYSNGCQSKTR